ncbi:MAG: Fumarate reductase flavoprotein subunit [Candidatus Anoxychlamydiales bacterium]|nr:Fumarate reductase flavoprotein subunit [Candidatus Anoxychlamydiales bacterium]
MKKVIVVGGGLAGLSCAYMLAKKNIFVYLVSLSPAKRSHSVCAQGGINASLSKNDDTPILHAYETIKGGDFLADQTPVLNMCIHAKDILKLLARLGVLFNRDKNEEIDFRNFGGSLHKRTAYCDSTTGQQLVYALDEQVRFYETKKLIKRLEHHEFLRLIQDQKGIARGIIYQDINTLEMNYLLANAIVIATGGIGYLFKKSTNTFQATGAANARLFTQGMKYANAEFIQIHPTAITGEDKLRLISEATRAEGGRIWVYGDENKKIKFPDGTFRSCGIKNQKWYFLEEMYPVYKNLVPRDIASKEILKVCELGLGVDGKYQVYLDVTHLSDETLKKIKAPLDIYRKFTKEDPKKVPMKIFPAVHYSMGGAYVDFPKDEDTDKSRYKQMTNIKGLFNIGESDYLFHGANRLGANSLLSCIFSGLVASKEIKRYLESNEFEKLENEILQKDLNLEKETQNFFFKKDGKENIFYLHDDLADLLLRNVTVKRNQKDLEKTLEEIKKIEKRFQNVKISNKDKIANQEYLLTSSFPYMIKLAYLITKCALKRDESRGAHFKEGYKKDDVNFLKTTIATYNQKTEDIEISYKDVDLSHFDPIPRDYQENNNNLPKIKNYPKTIESIL